MANPILSVDIAANLRNVIDGFTQASRAVREGAANMDASTVRAERSFALLNNTRFSFGANFTRSAAQISSSSNVISAPVSSAISQFTVLNNSRFTFGTNFSAAAIQAGSASRALATQAATTGARLGGSVATGSNQAAFALTNLGRVAQDAPFGFIGIQNNLNPLLESFQRLRAESGSNAAALRALGSSLMGPAGIGVALSLVGAAILFVQMGMRAWTGATKAAKAEAEDYAKSLEAIEGARLKGSQSAAKEISSLKTLFNIYQNANIPLVKRKEAYKEIQKDYPAYFGNLKFEAIATDATKNAYNRLTTSIIATAKARALSEKIGLNAIKDEELKNKILNIDKEIAKSRKEDTSYAGAFGGSQETKKLEDEKLQLIYRSNFLKNENLRLEKAITKEVQAGASARDNFGGVGGIDSPKSAKASERDSDLERSASTNETRLRNQIRDRYDKGIEAFQKEINETEIKIAPKFSTADDEINGDWLSGKANEYLEKTKEFHEGLKSMGDASIQYIGTFASALGEAMASGDFSNFGQNILSAVSGFLNQLGQLFIKQGIAEVAMGVAMNIALPGSGAPKMIGGYGMIAAGAGLSLVGGIASGIGKRKSNSGKSGDTNSAPSYPGFAMGVNNFKGGMAWVGEQGRELVRLPTGSDVIPNHKLSGLGGGSNMVLNGNFDISLETLHFALQRVGRKLERGM